MNKLDLEETTRRFHNVYEQVAKEYGYKTREDTKELDFNSPNGMTMLKTVETITTPYLEEIERLNNIINELEKYIDEDDWTSVNGEIAIRLIKLKLQELKEKTKLFHKNRVFSLEYDKETLTDMVLEYQEKIDKAIEYGKELILFDNESLEFEIGSNFINILQGE